MSPICKPGQIRYVDPTTNSAYHTASSTRPQPVYYDPLAIDLDGDGIETVGMGSAPVTFDHNADGVRTGSGWVTGDDAWLVLDRDGNGSIDSGRELFGGDTLKANGQFASSGLDALRDLDGNADGVFNASDAAFTQVRLWQDLNQDGISQAGELFSLSDRGLVSIGLTGSTSTSNLGNGNTVGATAVVTRADGSTTTASDLNVAHNAFYRDFTTEVPLSATALALPEMGGAGWVRDLRAAMSLGTAQADALLAQVQAFAAGGTKAGQMAQLDDLIRAWAASNEFVALKPLDDPLRRFVVANNPAMSAQMQAIIPVLEIFNALGVAQAGMQNPVLSTITAPDGTLQQVQTYTLFAEQVQPMLNAYEQLRQSAYAALVVQTRLKPYFDSVQLQIDATGVRFDVSAAITMVQGKAATDATNAVIDLLDVQKYASTTASAVGWQPYQTLESILETITVSPEVQALLNAERIVSLGAAGTNLTVTNAAGGTVLGNANANTLVGAGGSDQLYGFDGNDTLYANGYSDTLDGGAGDDTLTVTGSLYVAGNTFIGGAGNDTITGAYWNNTYVFNAGDGQDTVNNYNAGYGGYTDVLKFGADVAAADVTPVRSGVDLVFKLANGVDQVTVKNWFADGSAYRQIEQVKFADGTTWTSAQVNARALEVLGTAGADTLAGVAEFADVLRGADGNDTLYANGSSDTLDGGAGDDTLTVTGSLYVAGNTFIGGAGNDTITGAYWNNTYVFNAGDGQDTVNNYNAGYGGYTDVLKFGADVAAADVTPVRSGVDLVFKLANGVDQVTVKNWFADGSAYRQIEQVKFADGTTWTSAQVNAKLNIQTGTAAAETINGLTDRYNMISGLAGNDVLNGANSSDYIDGGIGDDTMAGQTGNDTYLVDSVNDIVVESASEGVDWVESAVTYALSAHVENLLLTGAAAINASGNADNNLLTGNSATNILTGGAGDDRLDGKAGADILDGGMGSDTYVLGHGHGADVIRENDATAGNTDVALFGSDIATSQLWFTQTGNDLEVSVIGTTDKLTVENWYLGSQYHVEQFKTSDGKTLLDSQVQNLVSAMAAFSPPAAGQTTLAAAYQTALAPVLVANWQ